MKEDRVHAQHNGKVWGCRQDTHSALPAKQALWVAVHATLMQRCNGSEVSESVFSPPTSLHVACVPGEPLLERDTIRL